MEQEVEWTPLFPKELVELNQGYEQFSKDLKAIDFELENAPTDEGPNPKNRPPGPEGYNGGMRAGRADHLEATREKRVQGYRFGIENSITSLSKKEQQTILLRFDYETSKGGFKDYSKDNLHAIKSLDKEDKASFDYMAASHFSQYQQPIIAKPVAKENIDTWSERYVRTLDDFKSRKREIDIDFDGPELEKE